MADPLIRGSFYNHAQDYTQPQERRVQVRCCCTPTKVLGTLPAPVGGASERTFQLTSGGMLKLGVRHYAQRVCVSQELLDRAADPVVAAYLQQGNVNELAYYSEDTPLEVLRLVPEFREEVRRGRKS
jgi:hypothetical protein